jgi:hypothetical protein
MSQEETASAKTRSPPQVGPGLTFTYATVQPDRWTFGADKIRAWVENFLEGDVLNACAGKTVLNHHSVHRNDIDTDIDADTHHDVRKLPEKLDSRYDVIIYDPPFTDHQATETYGQSTPGYGADVINTLDALLRPGGCVITFGYSTWGMPADRGYRHEAVGLFNTLGRQHDYLSVVSRHDPGHQPSTKADQTATVQANAIAPAEHSYEDQPEGRVELAYRVCEHETWFEAEPVRQWVEGHLHGRTLVVSNRPGVGQVDHEPLLVNATPDTECNTEAADMQLNPVTLSDALSQVFQSVVFAPPPSAFQATTEYRGQETGLSTAAKRELHEILEPDGRIIQLANTASCMRADFGYERGAVAIFAQPGDKQDLIGAVDHKRTNDLTDLCRQNGTTFKRCRACFGEWTTLDPAFRICCPQCGALAAHKVGEHLQGGEYCLNLDGTTPNAGTSFEGLHWARIQAAQKQLDDFNACPVTESGMHERVANHPVFFEPISPEDI